MQQLISPELVLRAYAAGIFPMAQSRNDPSLFWMDPRRRGILPVGGLHLSRSLRRRMRREPFELRVDSAFDAVLEGCAGREETWINADIFAIYLDLHRMGHAHSVETWEGDRLVGGVYGVCMGSAFFGESMFSHRDDASKIALAYLMARLVAGGFTLFDTQFVTDHLLRMGAMEITREAYRRRLGTALTREADFFRQSEALSVDDVIQLSTQAS